MKNYSAIVICLFAAAGFAAAPAGRIQSTAKTESDVMLGVPPPIKAPPTMSKELKAELMKKMETLARDRSAELFFLYFVGVDAHLAKWLTDARIQGIRDTMWIVEHYPED